MPAIAADLQCTRLLELAKRWEPDLLGAAYRLVAASRVAVLIFELPPTTRQDLSQLAGLARVDAPDLEPLCHRLAAAEDVLSALLLELQLDALVEKPDWRHPATLLTHPPIRRLIAACDGRLQAAEGIAAERLEEVRALLEKALRLRDTAAARRVVAEIEAQHRRSRAAHLPA